MFGHKGQNMKIPLSDHEERERGDPYIPSNFPKPSWAKEKIEKAGRYAEGCEKELGPTTSE